MVANPAQIQEALIQLQGQQVEAAWVQAWAAIAQAVGALLAIGISVWLALSSARRERDADWRAEQRAAAAEAAAETRARAAEEAALSRARNSKILAHNEPLNLVLQLADIAASACEREAAKYRFLNQRSEYVIPVKTSEFNPLLRSIFSAREDAREANLQLDLNRFAEFIEELGNVRGEPPEIADKLEQVAHTVRTRALTIEDYRMPSLDSV